MKRTLIGCLAGMLLGFGFCAAAETLTVSVGSAALVNLNKPMAEVIVANPLVADVHAHNPQHLSVVGKQIGRTNVRIFDKDGKVLRQMDIAVSYDLPPIRKALKDFLPEENIGVQMLNNSIALSGTVSGATAADKAMRLVRDFVQGGAGAPPAAGAVAGEVPIVNMMQIAGGQQVMLRVRVGEIQRSALQSLGLDLQAFGTGGKGDLLLATGGGIAPYVASTATNVAAINPGTFLLPGGQTPTNTRGLFNARLLSGGDVLAVNLRALEQDGLFKLLAEPNLVAISGEEAEFLAGGEIPIPIVQSAGAGANSISVEYKPFGVAVRFSPLVLGEKRIRMTVQPEVSEIDANNSITLSGVTIPGLSTRRAKTTVELAPGESFMIAGLIKDETRSSLAQLPGLKELPIIGALFRSTEFQRNETELVIAVTPYLVDGTKGADIKLPTDRFASPSIMESFFYGALAGQTEQTHRISQTPPTEGPIGFMVD